MNTSRTWGALSALLGLMPFGLLSASCGEESVCDKARAIERKFCQDYKDCFPCACVLSGKSYRIYFNAFMQVDTDASGCFPDEPCDGWTREHAEACMEYEHLCNPCYHPDLEIIMCGNPAFPELCGEPWWD